MNMLVPIWGFVVLKTVVPSVMQSAVNNPFFSFDRHPSVGFIFIS